MVMTDELAYEFSSAWPPASSVAAGAGARTSGSMGSDEVSASSSGSTRVVLAPKSAQADRRSWPRLMCSAVFSTERWPRWSLRFQHGFLSFHTHPAAAQSLALCSPRFLVRRCYPQTTKAGPPSKPMYGYQNFPVHVEDTLCS